MIEGGVGERDRQYITLYRVKGEGGIISREDGMKLLNLSLQILRKALKKKKRSKLGTGPNRGGGSGRGPPGSKPLNRFLKNIQNALKHKINT